MIQKLRDETPGCASRKHLNNAGASLPPQPVMKAIQEYLELESTIGGYEAAGLRSSELEGFYDAIAKILGCKARNIAFANSATDAYNRVLSVIPWKAGDLIVTTQNDYSSNRIAFLALQKRFGIRVEPMEDKPEGGLNLEAFSSFVTKNRPRLVAITHVPTNNGMVQPVEAIGAICRELDLLYLVDACQSAGQMPLDVAAIGCDFLTATMRKFMRGPRGAGFLFASDRVLEAGYELMLPDMRSATWTGLDTYETRSDARRFEYWEMSPALILGSKVAAEYAMHLGLDWIETQVKAIAGFARQQLSAIPGVQVHDKGDSLCGIVTAHASHWDLSTILDKLHAGNINCTISSRMVTNHTFPKPGIDWVLRVSPHYYNTEAEIMDLVDLLQREFPR